MIDGAGLFPGGPLFWGAIAAYLILLAVTRLFFHRQVTTELFLIVGWTALALSEINVLYGTGRFFHGLSAVFGPNKRRCLLCKGNDILIIKI